MGVLSDCLVVEMSEVFQAPVATQVLGDLGADVIKVERVDSGEILRRMDPVALETGRISSYFAAVNRNKFSITMDLKSEQGKAELSKLLAQADVFVHNYRPGAMERLGFGYEALAAANPRLVYAAATGYGASGPLAMQGGQDMVMQSITGMAMAASGSDGIPRFANAPSIDFASGMILAQGVLAALLAREKTGRGQRVSISLLDTAIAIQSLEAASQLMYGYETRWLERGLNFVFPTRDGWLTVLGFFRENPLSLMCRAMDLPDESLRPDLATVAQQIEHRDEIYALLRPSVAALARDEAYRRFCAADVLCAPMLTLAEALDHPQVRHNGMVVTVPVAGQSEAEVVANPLRLSDTPLTIRRGPPLLDADREEIRRRWLGAAVEPASPSTSDAT
ncbi:CoA transferase [Variovorax sp. J22P168]|uniref:CaiB/BaiF CoA transferase family protein n=1 Tax=Variovorax jilinensis TaxID=3053513 RepID=UPI002576BF7B|nr:CoA transferase [Variovorax sp. J22P168]MDM0014922.1 CoA transferase [Variovorax sp. J22P168]